MEQEIRAGAEGSGHITGLVLKEAAIQGADAEGGGHVINEGWSGVTQSNRDPNGTAMDV
jgi:hypothetical protein